MQGIHRQIHTSPFLFEASRVPTSLGFPERCQLLLHTLSGVPLAGFNRIDGDHDGCGDDHDGGGDYDNDYAGYIDGIIIPLILQIYSNDI